MHEEAHSEPGSVNPVDSRIPPRFRRAPTGRKCRRGCRRAPSTTQPAASPDRTHRRARVRHRRLKHGEPRRTKGIKKGFRILKPQASGLAPQAPGLKSSNHASADHQMHSWRDCKQCVARWGCLAERHRYDVRLSSAPRDTECLLRNQHQSSALSISGIYMCILHVAAFMHRTTNRTMASYISRITMWRSNSNAVSRLSRVARAGLFTITFRSTSAICHQ